MRGERAGTHLETTDITGSLQVVYLDLPWAHQLILISIKMRKWSISGK
jgi:hypothetical protein